VRVSHWRKLECVALWRTFRRLVISSALTCLLYLSFLIHPICIAGLIVVWLSSQLSIVDHAGVLANKWGDTVEAAGGIAAKLTKGGVMDALTSFALKKITYDERAAWNAPLTSPIVRVYINVSCRNLPHRTTRLANAFCVLWEVPRGYTGCLKAANNGRLCPLPRKQEHEIGRTEVVRDSQNPIFTESFLVQYRFELEQTYLIRIYDEDLIDSSDLKEHDFLGGAVFTLGELFGRPNHKLMISNIDEEHPDASLLLQGREVDMARKFLEFRFAAQNLTTTDAVLHAPDPFFKIERTADNAAGWETMWKSEVVFHNCSPCWGTACLSLVSLCGGNLDSDLRVTFWESHVHYEEDGYIGCAETTVRELALDTPEEGMMLPINIRRKLFFGAGRRKQKVADLQVIKSRLIDKPTFLQYLNGGLEIDLVVAVDCAAALDHKDEKKACHLHNGKWNNNYQMALEEIGSLVEPYSRSNYFNMWGFNAQVSFEDAENVFVMSDKVAGSQGLLKTYDNYLMGGNRFMARHQESHLGPLINKAMFRSIKETGKRHCYGLLCILTSGDVTDLEATVDAVLRAATDAPISIVFVGCECGNLDKVKGYFDKKKVQRSISGIRLSRDVTSFTSFSEFGNDVTRVMAEGLREVPEQMIQRFHQGGKDPRPPPTIDLATIANIHKAKNPSGQRKKQSKSPNARHRKGTSPNRAKNGHESPPRTPNNKSKTPDRGRTTRRPHD
jgi:Copine/C2 domain